MSRDKQDTQDKQALKASIQGTNPYALDDFWLMEQGDVFQKAYADTIEACIQGKEYVYDVDSDETYTEEWRQGYYQAQIDFERGYSCYEDGYVKAASKPSPQIMMATLYYQWRLALEVIEAELKNLRTNFEYQSPNWWKLDRVASLVRAYKNLNEACSDDVEKGYFGFRLGLAIYIGPVGFYSRDISYRFVQLVAIEEELEAEQQANADALKREELQWHCSPNCPHLSLDNSCCACDLVELDIIPTYGGRDWDWKLEKVQTLYIHAMLKKAAGGNACDELRDLEREWAIPYGRIEASVPHAYGNYISCLLPHV